MNPSGLLFQNEQKRSDRIWNMDRNTIIYRLLQTSWMDGTDYSSQASPIFWDKSFELTSDFRAETNRFNSLCCEMGEPLPNWFESDFLPEGIVSEQIFSG
jgi:hypothetical protein